MERENIWDRNHEVRRTSKREEDGNVKDIWDRKRGSPSLREREPITYGNVKDIRDRHDEVHR